MATHTSIAWRIPWKEEPGGLQSMASQVALVVKSPLSGRKLKDSHLLPFQRSSLRLQYPFVQHQKIIVFNIFYNFQLFTQKGNFRSFFHIQNGNLPVSTKLLCFHYKLFLFLRQLYFRIYAKMSSLSYFLTVLGR